MAQTLAEFVFSKIERIPNGREDKAPLQAMVVDYVKKRIKSEGGFFPNYEIALVNQEERKRYPNEPTRFDDYSYFLNNAGLLVRNGAVKLKDIKISRAIEYHPEYARSGGLAVNGMAVKHFKLIYASPDKLGTFLETLFDIGEGEHKKKVLRLKEQYSRVVLRKDNLD